MARLVVLGMLGDQVVEDDLGLQLRSSFEHLHDLRPLTLERVPTCSPVAVGADLTVITLSRSFTAAAERRSLPCAATCCAVTCKNADCGWLHSRCAFSFKVQGEIMCPFGLRGGAKNAIVLTVHQRMRRRKIDMKLFTVFISLLAGLLSNHVNAQQPRPCTGCDGLLPLATTGANASVMVVVLDLGTRSGHCDGTAPSCTGTACEFNFIVTATAQGPAPFPSLGVDARVCSSGGGVTVIPQPPIPLPYRVLPPGVAEFPIFGLSLVCGTKIDFRVHELTAAGPMQQANVNVWCTRCQ